MPTDQQIVNRAKIIAATHETPRGFRWDFNMGYVPEDEACGSAGCLIGLAIVLGIIPDSGLDWMMDDAIKNLASALGVGFEPLRRVCFPRGGAIDEIYGVSDYDRVTACMAGDKLEELFA